MEFFSHLEKEKEYDVDLKKCILSIIDKLNDIQTSTDNPGVLLGKIQSGKTKGFLGVIAKAFDVGYDIALVLTKGTRTLAKQTVSRMHHEFNFFIKEDYISIYDIMELPEKLHKPELKRKIIIVAKKEVNNLDRVISFFENDAYPDLKNKKILLIDDEADLASVRFIKEKKSDNAVETVQGKIAKKMDYLRGVANNMRFLQVTATPYSLYLQPENYENPFKFLPKKPAFTVLLPIHDKYIGGDDYFGNFQDDDPRKALYVEVENEEIEFLRSKGKIDFNVENILDVQGLYSLRNAFLSFLIGVSIRRWQQKKEAVKPKKYAMIIHNDTKRTAHNNQWDIVNLMKEALEKSLEQQGGKIKALFSHCFHNLKKTVINHGGECPTELEAYQLFSQLVKDEEINVQKVNSDVELASILDPNTAELKLRTEANIFIGGSLLDRGITIPNLLAFYYGRNPKNMQADTVLQHSRMYGARERSDLAVTRFYTSLAVFNRLKHIHEFDSALRKAFVQNDYESGIIFIQSDSSKGVIPCSPSKISVSRIMTINPGGYYLPSGFDLIESDNFTMQIDKISEKLERFKTSKPSLNNFAEKSIVLDVIRKIKKTMILNEDEDFYWDAMIGLLNYYCKAEGSDNVHVIVEVDRKITKDKSGDKSGRSIVGGQVIRELLEQDREKAAVVFLKQVGMKSNGWAVDYSFWWPILIAPTRSEPCVYSLP